MDPGINKPFDRVAKELAVESPRLFLQMLGLAGTEDLFHLELLRQETAPSVAMPDYVAELTGPGRDPCTFHVEFLTRYRSDIPRTMARYGGSLAWQYWRPVESVLLLLSEHGVPATDPTFGEVSVGKTVVRHPYRTIRLWEQDPETVLGSGDPGVMPWALLMRLEKHGAERLGRTVAATGNESWIARFLTLGSLRYDRNELENMLGGPRMGLVEAIMEGSSLVREAREKAAAEGRQDGRQEGRQEGQASEARRLLRLALAARFPGSKPCPELTGFPVLKNWNRSSSTMWLSNRIARRSNGSLPPPLSDASLLVRSLVEMFWPLPGAGPKLVQYQ